MVRKELAEGLYVVHVSDSIPYKYDSIERLCSIEKIDPEMLMSVLEGERDRYGGDRYYCVDEGEQIVPVRYQYINDGAPIRGGRRKGDRNNIAYWGGFTKAEYDQLIFESNRLGMTINEYIQDKLGLNGRRR